MSAIDATVVDVTPSKFTFDFSSVVPSRHRIASTIVSRLPRRGIPDAVDAKLDELLILL
jgi:hypothetical protein